MSLPPRDFSVTLTPRALDDLRDHAAQASEEARQRVEREYRTKRPRALPADVAAAAQRAADGIAALVTKDALRPLERLLNDDLFEFASIPAWRRGPKGAWVVYQAWGWTYVAQWDQGQAELWPLGLGRGALTVEAIVDSAQLTARSDVALRGFYTAVIRTGSLTLDIDPASLAAYLDAENRGERWLQLATVEGFVRPGEVELDARVEKNRREALFVVTGALKIFTLDVLDKWLVTRITSEVLRTLIDDGPPPSVLASTTIYDVLVIVLLYRAPRSALLSEAVSDLPYIGEVKGWLTGTFRDDDPSASVSVG